METRGHSPVDTSLNYNGNLPHILSRVSSESQIPALREICSTRDSAGVAQVAHVTHGSQRCRGSHLAGTLARLSEFCKDMLIWPRNGS